LLIEDVVTVQVSCVYYCKNVQKMKLKSRKTEAVKTNVSTRKSANVFYTKFFIQTMLAH